MFGLGFIIDWLYQPKTTNNRSTIMPHNYILVCNLEFDGNVKLDNVIMLLMVGEGKGDQGVIE